MISVSFTRTLSILVILMITVGIMEGRVAAAAQGLAFSVQAEEKSIKNGGFLSIVANIQNVGNTIQTLHIWSCSYERNWKTDSLFARVMHGHCNKDAIRNVKLEAGETYKHTLNLGIEVPDRGLNKLSELSAWIYGRSCGHRKASGNVE
jgi:hypothetical protein